MIDSEKADMWSISLRAWPDRERQKKLILLVCMDAADEVVVVLQRGN